MLDTISNPKPFVQAEAGGTAEFVPAVREPRQGEAAARGIRRREDEWDVAAAARWQEIEGCAALVRSIMLNHWYHHRGQLLVYLRLLNQSVPSVYGPMGDENPFPG